MKKLGTVFCILFILFVSSCENPPIKNSSKIGTYEDEDEWSSVQLMNGMLDYYSGINYSSVHKVAFDSKDYRLDSGNLDEKEKKNLDVIDTLDHRVDMGNTNDSSLNLKGSSSEDQFEQDNKLVQKPQFDFKLDSKPIIVDDKGNEDEQNKNIVDDKEVKEDKQPLKNEDKGNDDEVELEDIQESINLNFKENLGEPTYDELLKSIKDYKISLSDKLIKFNSDASTINFSIPFNKISPEFNSAYKQNEVYAALGYDVDLIKKLGDVFARLNLADARSFNDSLKVSKDILSVLSNTSRYFQESLSFVNDDFLDKVKNEKSKYDVERICSILVKIGELRDGFIQNVSECLQSLESLTDEKNIVAVLTEKFAQNGDIKRKSSSLKEFNEIVEGFANKLKVK